jgi:hypothetical protein
MLIPPCTEIVKTFFQDANGVKQMECKKANDDASKTKVSVYNATRCNIPFIIIMSQSTLS